LNDQHVRIDREQADSREILQRIVGHLLHVRTIEIGPLEPPPSKVYPSAGCLTRTPSLSFRLAGLVVHDKRCPSTGTSFSDTMRAARSVACPGGPGDQDHL